MIIIIMMMMIIIIIPENLQNNSFTEFQKI